METSLKISRNGNFVEEYFSTMRKNCLHWQEYLQNQIKWLPVVVIRVLNRLFYNLNNGFHLQERKLGIKNNAFSFGLENGFPLSRMKDSLKNKSVNGRKWFPLSRKSFSIRKNKFCLQKLFSADISDRFWY